MAAVVVAAVAIAVVSFDIAPDSKPDDGSVDLDVGEDVSAPTQPDSDNGLPPAGNNDTSAVAQSASTIKEITSIDHLMAVLDEVVSYDWRGGGSVFPVPFARESVVMDTDTAFFSAEGSANSMQSNMEHSDTNIQVMGVDEPDYIKNDGQYVYIVDDNTLSIIDAWPAEDTDLVTKVALDIGSDSGIHDIFLNEDRLVMFYVTHSDNVVIPTYDFAPTRSHEPVTRVLVIDISDRNNPRLHHDYSIDGWFEDARMIGQHAYVVTTSWIDHGHPRLPVIMDGDVEMAPRAYYFEDDWEFSTFTTLAAIDILEDVITSETFMMGNTRTYYVSNDNFYLTYNQWPSHGFHDDLARERFFSVIVPLLPDDVRLEIMSTASDVAHAQSPQGEWTIISQILQDYYNQLDPKEKDDLFGRIQEALATYDKSLAMEMTRTVIHKISIDGNDINYVAQGLVPGRLLNQFSLGEDASTDRLRVATTIEYPRQFDGFGRSNGVYTLDGQMNPVGKLEEIAPGERIYSTRFMDDRLYMVTFRQIDPFFVIDISADKPVVLGELKIPGFSNYLHPYDGDHVIGIGRDVKAETGRQLGVKIALFNVSDVSNPAVVDDLVIGGSSTHSEALGDHKAFFFDSRNNIISIPMAGTFRDLSKTLDASEVANTRDHDSIYHDNRRWSGFYVLDVSPAAGVDVRGTISHSAFASDSYWMERPRTFYIGDVLYTVSDVVLLASDMGSLESLGWQRLGGTGSMIDYLD